MSAEPTAADWAAFLSLGVGGWAACAALLYLVVDADLQDFDPRPAVARVLESGRVDPLLIAVASARYCARTAVRDAAVSVAALLMLLVPSAPEATR